MTPWQWIAAGALGEIAIFLALCVWGAVTDARNERDRRAAAQARETRRREAAEDQRNVDMTFAQLTDPAHFGKTGGPA